MTLHSAVQDRAYFAQRYMAALKHGGWATAGETFIAMYREEYARGAIDLAEFERKVEGILRGDL